VALRRLVTGAAVAALLTVGAGAASAEPVQQFGVQLKDITADGRYSVVYTSNAFDTTGEAPPALSEASLRLAKGMTIKKDFLKPGRLCDTAKFGRYVLLKRPKGTTYAQAIDAFPKTAARIERQLPGPAATIVSTCRTTFLGRGTAVIDARQGGPATTLPKEFSPTAPVPAKFSLFLARPTAKGAVAGIGVLAHYDASSPIAVNEPWYAVLQRTFTLNVFDDPTPDGQYGYRISLPTERTSGFRFSIAELRVESSGLVGRTSRGPRDFWATPPVCPASGQVPFRADYRYVTGLTSSTVVQVACPRFQP
jgi:hypothetical protein